MEDPPARRHPAASSDGCVTERKLSTPAAGGAVLMSRLSSGAAIWSNARRGDRSSPRNGKSEQDGAGRDRYSTCLHQGWRMRREVVVRYRAGSSTRSCGGCLDRCCRRSWGSGRALPGASGGRAIGRLDVLVRQRRRPAREPRPRQRDRPEGPFATVARWHAGTATLLDGDPRQRLTTLNRYRHPPGRRPRQRLTTLNRYRHSPGRRSTTAPHDPGTALEDQDHRRQVGPGLPTVRIDLDTR